MTSKKICVIGSGKKFAAFAFGNKINIAYDSDDGFRVKTLNGKLQNPKLNKTIKIHGDICLPICDFFLVQRNGKNKITKGE